MRTPCDLDRGLADLLRLVATILGHRGSLAAADDPEARRRVEHDLEAAVEALRRIVSRLDLPAAASPSRPRVHALTGRERLMAELLCGGKSYKEIASALELSVLSVQSRVKQIYMKVAVHTKAELRSALIDGATPPPAGRIEDP